MSSKTSADYFKIFALGFLILTALLFYFVLQVPWYLAERDTRLYGTARDMFQKKFDSVQNGQTKAEIETGLGKPLYPETTLWKTGEAGSDEWYYPFPGPHQPKIPESKRKWGIWREGIPGFYIRFGTNNRVIKKDILYSNSLDYR